TRGLDVRVRRDFLPRRVAGRAQALCTVARTSWAAAALALGAERFDVVVFDLVAWPIPVVRALDRRRPRIVYYCHYPDQLLAPPAIGPSRLYPRPAPGPAAGGLLPPVPRAVRSARAAGDARRRRHPGQQPLHRRRARAHGRRRRGGLPWGRRRDVPAPRRAA